jgi:hypothetical protein
MSKKIVLPSLLVATIAVVALFGVLNFNKAYAQTPTATPAAPSTEQQQANPKVFGDRRGGRLGISQQDLATALGIDLVKLQDAYVSANTEALKQAVADGLITQAQADAITARGLSNGPIGGFEHFLGQNQTSTIDYNALLAKALGITTDQLTAARQKAFNTAVDNAVQAGTLTQAQADLIKGREALAADSKFQSSMQSAFQAAVQQAVTGGVITQAQADAILQAQQNQTGRGFFGFGEGFEGRHGRDHGGFWGVPPANNGTNNDVDPTPNSAGL